MVPEQNLSGETLQIRRQIPKPGYLAVVCGDMGTFILERDPRGEADPRALSDLA